MAEHSPDRQARAAAVECLHAVILWMVGEALHGRLRLQAFSASVSDVGSSTSLRSASSLGRVLLVRRTLFGTHARSCAACLCGLCDVPASTCGARPTRRARAGTNAKRARARARRRTLPRGRRASTRCCGACCRPRCGSRRPPSRSRAACSASWCPRWCTGSRAPRARAPVLSFPRRRPPPAALPQSKAASRLCFVNALVAIHPRVHEFV